MFKKMSSFSMPVLKKIGPIRWACLILTASMTSSSLCTVAAQELTNHDDKQKKPSEVLATESKQTTTSLPELTVKADADAAIPTEKSRVYTIAKSSSATKMNLSPRETPQSISVLTRAQLDDFSYNNVNDALTHATGVSVEKWETDRTGYMSRGFDISNFQYDGLGVPLVFDGIVNSDSDTAIYDRVEVIRGANGLVSSLGNPSATINFIRKRPTYPFQAAVRTSVGSWHRKRIEADVSGALDASKNVAARLVAAHESGDSYLERYSSRKAVLYGVIEANINDTSVLTAGVAYQKNNPKGNMWGALPLRYSDGTPTQYRTSLNPAANWAFWNTGKTQGFLEWRTQLQPDWDVKITAHHNILREKERLFYIYGVPDRKTGQGVFSWPAEFDQTFKESIVDVHFTGKYTLMDRKHDLSFGVNWANSKNQYDARYGRGIGTPVGDLNTWTGDYPLPIFDARFEKDHFDDYRKNAFVATRLNVTEQAHLLLGSNLVQVHSQGNRWGDSNQKSATKNIPYVGGVYDVHPHISLYASYAQIFSPQNKPDVNGKSLDPVMGKNQEIGFKSEWLNRKLNTSLAIFKSQQSNLPEEAGRHGIQAYFKGTRVHSRGVELDVSGEISRGWQISAGVTQLHMQGEGGDKDAKVKTYVPRKTLHASSTYQLPASPQWKIGTSLRWQGEIYRVDDGVRINQAAYALWDAMVQYDINPKTSLILNIRNLSNQRYLNSLYYDQSYYGAPRQSQLTLYWNY